MATERSLNPAVIAGVVIVLVLVFVYGYAVPRHRSNQALAQEIQQLEQVRGQLLALLPEVEKLHQKVPDPPSSDDRPDLRSWIAQNALIGLEKNLISNDSYAQGAGASVKLRKLSPAQTVRFFGELTRVNLMLERLDLNDWDGDGRWDIELMVRVPGEAE